VPVGNEFGHPDWLDFPREGNDDSYHYARRQWSLVDNKAMRFHFLNCFDHDLNHLEIKLEWLASEQVMILNSSCLVYHRCVIILLTALACHVLAGSAFVSCIALVNVGALG